VCSGTRYIFFRCGNFDTSHNALNLQSVLAAAGIGGLAVGFASQSLIKDVISGAFIVFETSTVLGYGNAGRQDGVVEEIELR